MTIYKLEYSDTSLKQLRKLSPQIRERLLKALKKLAANPCAGSVRSMVGTKSWRLRVGDYRVIYDIHDAKLVILVLRVRHRRDVYKA